MSTDDQTEQGDSTALMIYDGDCGFCTYWVRRWRRKIGSLLEITPLQDDAARPEDLPVHELEEAVHLVDPDGRVFRGAEAVFRALALRRRYALGWWLYRWMPGFRWISEWSYRWVANHRMAVSRWTRWLRRDDE